MAESFQSVWMALLLASITMMLLQPQQGQAESIEEFGEKLKQKCNTFEGKHRGSKISCDTFWKMFSSAFVNKDPSKITPADYDNLVKAVSIEIPQNKLLLYSGTGQLLPDNPDTYVHVWQTIYGILGNFPLWCVMKNGKEVFSEGCDSKNPKCRDCSHKPADEYWAAVSTAFAKAASGSVIVLLNGDLGYMDDSYFAKYEVPNLDFSSKGVTALRVLMVNKIDADSCKKANLIKLQEDMKEHKNLYHCRYILETEFKKLSAVDWWNKAKSG